MSRIGDSKLGDLLRMSVSDVAWCPKTGLFKPSINPAADHETGLAEPKQTQHRGKENPPDVTKIP